MAGHHGRIYIRVQVGDSAVECHLKALDEGRVLGDVIGRHTDAPCDLTDNLPDSERNTAPMPAGPVGLASLRRAAPSVCSVALIYDFFMKGVRVQSLRMAIAAADQAPAAPNHLSARVDHISGRPEEPTLLA